MGSTSLRTVFETALGLPRSFATIDLDQQLEVFKSKTQSAFGESSVSQFTESENRDELLRRFFALGQIGDVQSASVSSASAALTMLQLGTVEPLVSV